MRFIDDGRIEIDNNTVERSIKPIGLGKKNYLFAGSEGGAETWAILGSLGAYRDRSRTVAEISAVDKANARFDRGYLHDDSAA
jgi:hypothetical protein